MRRFIAGTLLCLSIPTGCDSSKIRPLDPRKAYLQMERAADESPYESELWRRFVEIVSEQNKQGRANLVIDHLVGAPDLLDHIQLSDRPIFLCMAMDSEISNGGISRAIAFKFLQTRQQLHVNNSKLKNRGLAAFHRLRRWPASKAVRNTVGFERLEIAASIFAVTTYPATGRLSGLKYLLGILK